MGDGGNLDVVRMLYEALVDGDIEAVLDLVADDVVLEVHGPASVPFSGVHKGRQGLIDFFEVVGDHAERDLDDGIPSVHRFIDGGDSVVALGIDRIRVRASGSVYESWWVHVLDLRDRKVVRIQEFIDTAAAIAAFPPVEPRDPPSPV